MSLDKEKRVASLYFDPINPVAFTTIKNLYQAVKEKQWTDISRTDVKHFLQKTRVYTLHKHHKKGKTGPIFSWGINYLWEIDLADVQSLSFHNRGIRYVHTATFYDTFLYMLYFKGTYCALSILFRNICVSCLFVVNLLPM